MARGLNFTVQAVGARNAANNLEGIARRMTRLQPAFREVTRVLEAGEERVFAGGKFTDTGALRNSLTQPHANGAIREIHGDSLEFGTSIPYARYQHTKRSKKNAVVVLRPKERKLSAAILLRAITRKRGLFR